VETDGGDTGADPGQKGALVGQVLVYLAQFPIFWPLIAIFSYHI
jgi:hypothetical protein